jgi:hypothetical protein
LNKWKNQIKKEPCTLFLPFDFIRKFPSIKYNFVDTIYNNYYILGYLSIATDYLSISIYLSIAIFGVGVHVVAVTTVALVVDCVDV